MRCSAVRCGAVRCGAVRSAFGSGIMSVAQLDLGALSRNELESLHFRVKADLRSRSTRGAHNPTGSQSAVGPVALFVVGPVRTPRSQCPGEFLKVEGRRRSGRHGRCGRRGGRRSRPCRRDQLGRRGAKRGRRCRHGARRRGTGSRAGRRGRLGQFGARHGRRGRHGAH